MTFQILEMKLTFKDAYRETIPLKKTLIYPKRIKCRIPGTRPTYSPFNFTMEHVGQIIGEYAGRNTGEHFSQVTGENVG